MKGSLWAWITHRITAVVLVVLGAIHFGVMHFVDPTAVITFGDSQMRLQSALYLVVDAGLLVTGLYHGLNGVRNIILDYWPGAGRAAGWILTAIGVVAAGYGSLALAAFLAN
ncbi:MAG: succinate dehydrogenase hydrophobic membrane anchor subunit [Symbiobacterium sp.]|uniref:succinate dehydrogenase hydrophobic membrane anchor subunit n=1 Tax=Symbiobacterium sp. TaxID=1971213 RepID=UPI003463D435